MRRVTQRFTDGYGAHPAHLAVLLAALALAAYAGSFLLGDPALITMLVWFVGAAVVHDLVLYPLYALGDRLLTGLLPRTAVPLVNHVRIPLLASGLTLLMFLPGIVRQGEATHLAATGLDQQPYLGRWLLLVAAFAGTSALVYALRVACSPHRQQQVVDPERQRGLGGEPGPSPR